MPGEIEEPFRLNFQSELLQSGSISFGRFESESLSWERRSIFPHNRYLEEVEKYSKPGTVTEKKAYFEAEFRRKALLKQRRSSECQDGGGESTTVDMHDFEEYMSNCNDGPCSSNTSNCNTETEIQDHDVDDERTTPKYNSMTGYDRDTHSESQNHEFVPVTTQDELGQNENENVAGNNTTEQSADQLTLVDLVPNVSSEANDDSLLACRIPPEKDIDSLTSLPLTAFSRKVKPVAEKKLTRSTVKTQAIADWSKNQFLNEGSKGSIKTRTSESKVLPVKKSPRPATPLVHSGGRSFKAEGLKSEKAVKVKAPFPLLEKFLPGGRLPIVNRSKPNVNPNKTHVSRSATGFSFKTDQRVENRKEFYTKIAEKMHAKEVEINQVEAKSLKKQAAEMKQFRKSLNFKAKPLPSFYNESARILDQPKVTPIRKTPNQPRPRSQAMATRHDKNTLNSSVPLNIKPSSSASRMCISESVGINRFSEKKDKEKGKDTKLNKQKKPEQRGRDMVKGIHTSKVGIVS